MPADPSLVPWLPALRAVIPAVTGPGGTVPGSASHGELSNAVRAEAVLQLLRRLGDGRVVLLLLEDLHWADPDTARGRGVPDATTCPAEPVLCVATCREETASAACRADSPADQPPAPDSRSHWAASRRTRSPRWCAHACRRQPTTLITARSGRLPTGVPFLVEESLAAPGVPRSFADGVRSRLAGSVSPDERLVLHYGRAARAAVRLAAAAGRDRAQPPMSSTRPWSSGVGSQLLGLRRRCVPVPAHADQGSGGGRAAAHPAGPRSRRGALAALRGDLDPAAGENSADLARGPGARRPDDQDEAGAMLLMSGRRPLDARRARHLDRARCAGPPSLLSAGEQRLEAEMLLVEGLALAGQVDEAMTDRRPAAGRAARGRPGWCPGRDPPEARSGRGGRNAVGRLRVGSSASPLTCSAARPDASLRRGDGRPERRGCAGRCRDRRTATRLAEHRAGGASGQPGGPLSRAGAAWPAAPQFRSERGQRQFRASAVDGADAQAWPCGDSARCMSLAPSKCSITLDRAGCGRPGRSPTSSAPRAPAR